MYTIPFSFVIGVNLAVICSYWSYVFKCLEKLYALVSCSFPKLMNLVDKIIYMYYIRTVKLIYMKLFGTVPLNFLQIFLLLIFLDYYKLFPSFYILTLT